jgi:hypothetical protein
VFVEILLFYPYLCSLKWSIPLPRTLMFHSLLRPFALGPCKTKLATHCHPRSPRQVPPTPPPNTYSATNRIGFNRCCRRHVPLTSLHRLMSLPVEALFTSKVFEGIGGDYFVSRNFPDRLFTSPGFEGIIPRYPHNSPPL